MTTARGMSARTHSCRTIPLPTIHAGGAIQLTQSISPTTRQNSVYSYQESGNEMEYVLSRVESTCEKMINVFNFATSPTFRANALPLCIHRRTGTLKRAYLDDRCSWRKARTLTLIRRSKAIAASAASALPFTPGQSWQMALLANSAQRAGVVRLANGVPKATSRARACIAVHLTFVGFRGKGRETPPAMMCDEGLGRRIHPTVDTVEWAARRAATHQQVRTPPVIVFRTHRAAS
eukprot:3342915-Prymnesium_polylepis.2